MTFDAATDPVLRSECGFAVSTFVGRREELRDIRQRLSDFRLVTLTGVGGVGKSRLAHRATASLRRFYQDRVYCVDLVEAHDSRLLSQDVQNPEVLAHLIGTTIGAAQEGANTALKALVTSFSAQPVLLLLDNCESLLPACAVVADSLLRACPQLRILATSREPLWLDGELIFPVQPLPTPPTAEPGSGSANVSQLRLSESMALFVSRAEAVSDFVLTEENTPATAELCRRLDGLPLAIELAAARMRTLAPAQMLQRTGDRFALLSRGSRTAPPRQQTLRACVDWSFELCSKPERQLWSRLSVFPGAFELDAVEGICADESLPTPGLLDLVAGLVNKSVLISESSGDRWRYRMLETIRDYGLEKLIESGGQDDLRRRHRDFYRALIRSTASDRFGTRQVDWLTRLDHELPNLRAALTYSLAAPDEAEAALEMAAGLWPLWAARGRHAEGRRWLDEALARKTGPTMHRLEAAYGNAVLAAALGDLDAVRTSAQQAQAVAAELADGRAYAISACVDGVLAVAGGDLAAAARDYSAAADGFAAGDAAGWRMVALTGLTTTLALLGEVEAAARHHQEIVAGPAASGESLLTGTALGSLGLALYKQGDLETAAIRLRDGLRRLRRVDDRLGLAWCLRVLARIARDGNRAEQAATLLGAAAGIGNTVVLTTIPGLPPADQEEAERRTRAALGKQAFRTAFASGRAMSVDDAVGYGLDERRRPMPAGRQVGSTSLTRRELQVAELVGQGRSNKDIAAALVISQRTAESHVEKILTKLGLTSRSQIAVWMVRTHATAQLTAA